MKRRAKFSERIGAVALPNTLRTDGITPELRNSLWNLLLDSVFSGNSDHWARRVKEFWQDVFKLPVDEVKSTGYASRDQLKRVFFGCSWYQVLDLIEYVAGSYKRLRSQVERQANEVFEEHFCGFRFVAGELGAIADQEEINSIEESVRTIERGFYGTGTHIKKALSLLSQRPSPDYLNSIKESISAVESVVKQLTGEKAGGLSAALKKLDEQLHFHPAFRDGLEKLYGYSSDEDGIRHAILEEKNIGFAEAKFMLVACSALVNFMIAKADQHNLLPRQDP